MQAFRASGAKGQIGTSTAVTDVQPASESEADVAAARRYNAFDNEMFLDPVMLGAYPAEIVERLGEAWPGVRDGDLATISSPIDFLGVTYYSTEIVRARDEPVADDEDRRLEAMLDVRLSAPPGPVTGLGWPIRPEGVSNVLGWLRDRYANPPIIVTENGAAVDDVVAEDGSVNDPERIAYIRDHLIAAHGSIQKGVDLRGWFVWALLDTWEFWLGFKGRFGLIHVDYQTQQRTVKSSGRWFRDVMATNGFEAP